jgi:hypothetical protein
MPMQQEMARLNWWIKAASVSLWTLFGIAIPLILFLTHTISRKIPSLALIAFVLLGLAVVLIAVLAYYVGKRAKWAFYMAQSFLIYSLVKNCTRLTGEDVGYTVLWIILDIVLLVFIVGGLMAHLKLEKIENSSRQVTPPLLTGSLPPPFVPAAREAQPPPPFSSDES